MLGMLVVAYVALYGWTCPDAARCFGGAACALALVLRMQARVHWGRYRRSCGMEGRSARAQAGMQGVMARGESGECTALCRGRRMLAAMEYRHGGVGVHMVQRVETWGQVSTER